MTQPLTMSAERERCKALERQINDSDGGTRIMESRKTLHDCAGPISSNYETGNYGMGAVGSRRLRSG